LLGGSATKFAEWIVTYLSTRNLTFGVGGINQTIGISMLFFLLIFNSDFAESRLTPDVML